MLGVEGLLHMISQKDTPQSVGLLWTRDRPVAAGDRPQTLALDRSATGTGLIDTQLVQVMLHV